MQPLDPLLIQRYPLGETITDYLSW